MSRVLIVDDNKDAADRCSTRSCSCRISSCLIWDDGEPRVMIANLDPATGGLTWDERFRDPGSTRAGVSFARETWPHGTVHHAMPHGSLFGPGRAP